MVGIDVIQDPHSISTIASAIGTSVAGKKAAIGGAILAMSTEKITINHALAAIMAAMITGAVSTTLWGSGVKNKAEIAYSMAVQARENAKQNHEKAESLNDALHIHAIEAEKRLGVIESDIKVIKHQNDSIINLLKTHDGKESDR